MNKLNKFKNLTQQFSILFVEDDDTLRETTVELLDGLFKHTVSAVDGKQALSYYEMYHEEKEKYFDIVISDIEMPNMDGISLSKEILKINKKQKILIISAYDDKKYFIELINMGVSGIIQKPLSSKQLFSTLKEVCMELEQEKETLRFLKLTENLHWDRKNSILYQDEIEVTLTKNEKMTIELLLSDVKQTFTGLEIFEYIYQGNPDKTFSFNAIKSLIKRLRKKVPNLIQTISEKGYTTNISI